MQQELQDKYYSIQYRSDCCLDGYEDTNENKLISKKISDYDDELKGWDPTDPDENNPWREYIEQNKGENK